MHSTLISTLVCQHNHKWTEVRNSVGPVQIIYQSPFSTVQVGLSSQHTERDLRTRLE